MVKPVGARVLIRYKEDDGRIVIPETVRGEKWELTTAEVVAVGDGALLETGRKVPVCVKPGDVVLVPRNTGYTLRIDGQDYVMINERDVAAVVEK